MTIQITNDLILEIWPGAAGDQSLLKLRSLALEQDAQTAPGSVVIYPHEIRRLIAALIDAAATLVDQQDDSDE